MSPEGIQVTGDILPSEGEACEPNPMRIELDCSWLDPGVGSIGTEDRSVHGLSYKSLNGGEYTTLPTTPFNAPGTNSTAM